MTRVLETRLALNTMVYCFKCRDLYAVATALQLYAYLNKDSILRRPRSSLANVDWSRLVGWGLTALLTQF